MQDDKKSGIKSPLTPEDIIKHKRPVAPATLVEYFGNVCYSTNERVLGKIKELVMKSPNDEVTLLVSSPGGSSGIAMSFYDTVRSVLRPNLVTIGMGDVDSSGIIIFLTGKRRVVSEHTTLLFHAAGRTFDPSKRYTATEIEAMAKEDKLKDEQYASIVSQNSRGRLTPQQVLLMMECNTVLTAPDMLRLGLADEVLRQ